MNLGFAAVAALDDPPGTLDVSAQVVKQLRMADEEVQGRRRPGVAAGGVAISLWLPGDQSQEQASAKGLRPPGISASQRLKQTA
jgi:hypothetical protein